MEFQWHNKKKKRKRTPSQLRNKRRRKKEKRRIIESQLLHIPQGIIDNILSRLPVKSLMRFKSVCKRWRFTISDPNFQKRESESVFAMVNFSHSLFLYSIDEKATMEAFPVPWDKKYLRSSSTRVDVSNSCNGMVLICLNISLFLFNPSTRYFVKVLKLNRLNDLNYGTTMGLCYDESISDYKAVIRLSHLTPDYGGEFVIVSSLKGKQWVQVSFPFNVSYVREGPVVKGRLHWAVCDLNNDNNDYFVVNKKITCFDPILNIFHVLPTPHPKSGDEHAIVGLGVLEGCLCMARRDNKNDFKGDVEVLAMKEYGVAKSWTTMFVLSNLDVNRYHERLNPLLITKDGEVLILKKSNKIWAYNLAKKSYREYHIPTGGNWLSAVSLVENIVSPVGYYWDRMEHEDFRDEIKWQRR